MKSILKILAFSAAIVIPYTGLASLSPEEVVLRIVSRSPSALASEKEAEASLLEAMTETALPAPEIEGEYLIGPSGVKNRWGAGVSWGIDWPGLYGARNEEAVARGLALNGQYKSGLRESEVEVKRLLLDYVLQEKQLGILSELQATTDSIKNLSLRAHAGGEITRLDLNKLDIESAGIRARKAEILDQRASTLGALRVIAGFDCTPLLADMECDFPELSPLSEAFDPEKSPAILAARAETSAARKGVRTAGMESRPGFTIGYKHAFEDGSHFNGFSLGMTLPFLSRRAGKARKAAEAAQVAAHYRAESSLATARQTLESETRRYEILRANIVELEPLVEQADNLPLLMKAYKGGAITLLDYLNERNYFTEARLNLLSLRRAAAETLVNMSLYAPAR